MKNIAVLIYDLTVEYHITVLDGILSFFKDRNDVNVLIAPVNVPHATTNEFDYQYWSIVNVLRNKKIDSVIVVVNSFVEYYPLKKLEKELACLLPKPIISISVPLNIPTNSYTYISSEQSYIQVVNHLKEKHGCKKIAHFSAELSGSPESNERLQSYKKALKANGLKFDSNLVFPGDFTPACTHAYLANNYKSKKNLNFDALLCANDYMAVGAIGALEMNGIKVPDDVCVFGFDDAVIAVESTPTVSTINQHIVQSGKKAAELAYKAACGEKIAKKEQIDAIPIYRQSCGCIENIGKNESYYDQSGKLFEKPNTTKSVLNLFGNALNDMSKIYHMLNMTESVIDFNDYYETLLKNLEIFSVDFFAVCLYDKPMILFPKDNFVLPKTANLVVYYNLSSRKKKNYFDQGGISFDTETGLLPASVEEPDFGSYYILPVSLQSINYGYVICKIPNKKYTVYAVFLKILINAMAHSYEYSIKEQQKTELVSEKEKSELIARTDELTKVLNRRGFLEIAQKQINISKATKVKGTVFFFDMDGLKKINDTYGHKIGDVAIKTMATVLSKACRTSDIVGRISGDEFAILAPGYESNRISELRLKIQKLSEKLSKKANLPIIVSMSVGAAEYSEMNSDLQTLLSEADKELYIEKRIKHSKDNL